MVIDFANLPRNAIDCICKYVESGSVLQMRKVSKSIKESVDLFIVRTREIQIDTFTLHAKEEVNKAVIWFDFEKSWDHCVWKSCFQHVMNKLEITSFDLEDNLGLFLNKRIIATLNLEDVVLVFNHLKSFMRKTTFGVIRLSRFWEIREIIHACVDCLGQSTAYSLDDRVKTLNVWLWSPAEAGLKVVSVAREFLNRKFKNVDISFARDMTFTLADTEALLQILHDTEQKACIEGWTNEDLMHVTVGICSIKIQHQGAGIHMGRHITIKHL